MKSEQLGREGERKTFHGSVEEQSERKKPRRVRVRREMIGCPESMIHGLVLWYREASSSKGRESEPTENEGFT